MKTVIALSGVYASGVKLAIGEQNDISDDDYRILSGMKKVRLVEEAKAKAEEVKTKTVKKSTKKRGTKNV